MEENCEWLHHQVIENVTYIKKNPVTSDRLADCPYKGNGLTMKQNLLNYKIVR